MFLSSTAHLYNFPEQQLDDYQASTAVTSPFRKPANQLHVAIASAVEPRLAGDSTAQQNL